MSDRYSSTLKMAGLAILAGLLSINWRLLALGAAIPLAIVALIFGLGYLIGRH